MQNREHGNGSLAVFVIYAPWLSRSSGILRRLKLGVSDLMVVIIKVMIIIIIIIMMMMMMIIIILIITIIMLNNNNNNKLYLSIFKRNIYNEFIIT